MIHFKWTENTRQSKFLCITTETRSPARMLIRQEGKIRKINRCLTRPLDAASF
jgi:hypothetical protein